MELRKEFKIPYGLIWPLLITACLLRVLFPELIEFKYDEYMGIKLAYENIHGAGFAYTGLRSSIGLYNPPFFIYLLSLPALFTTDPIAVTYFVIGLNLVGLAFLYFFLTQLFSRHTALIILTLFASSPWSILYSRKIWAQDCLFFFMMLFYIVLLFHIRKYQSRNVYFLSILLALITQLHMSAWLLPFPLLLFFFIFKLKINIKDSMIGLLLIVVIYLPYLVFLIKENSLSIISSNHSSTVFDLFRDSDWRYFIRSILSPAWKNGGWSFIITGGAGFQYFLGKTGLQAFGDKYPIQPLYFVFTLYYFFAVWGLLYVIKISYKEIKYYWDGHELAENQQILILFLFIYLGIQISYFILNVHSYPHYSIVIYPILTIFTVLFFKYCFDKGNYLVKKGVTILLTLIVLSNIFFMFSFFSFIKKYPDEIAGDYQSPYFLTKEQWKQRLP